MPMTKMKSRASFDKDELTIIKTLAQAIAAANKKVLGKSVTIMIPNITIDDWTDLNLDSISLYTKLGINTGAMANIMHDLSSKEFSLLHKVILKNQKPILDYFHMKLKWWEKIFFPERARDKLLAFDFKLGLKPEAQ
jgi:hypothetical protein